MDNPFQPKPSYHSMKPKFKCRLEYVPVKRAEFRWWTKVLLRIILVTFLDHVLRRWYISCSMVRTVVQISINLERWAGFVHSQLCVSHCLLLSSVLHSFWTLQIQDLDWKWLQGPPAANRQDWQSLCDGWWSVGLTWLRQVSGAVDASKALAAVAAGTSEMTFLVWGNYSQSSEGVW